MGSKPTQCIIMKLKYKCKYCNKELNRPCALAMHERTCKLNPNRKPLENHVCNWPKKKSNNDWVCNFCNLKFNTKSELYNHKHNAHNIETRQRNQICPYCGQIMANKRKHFKICENKRHQGFKWSDEEKKNLSEKRKVYLKEHPDEHPWKRNTKFKSKPCEHLKTVLKQKFNFEEEYTDIRWEHNYSIDIAFLDKKLAIEVNGNQHYTNEGKLNTYFQNRHDYLAKQGWRILEVHYSWCYKEDKIQEIVTAIENSIEIDLTEHELLFAYKQKTLEERNKEKQKNKEKRNEEKEKRKLQILNSGVDLTKFGWVDKVSQITKLTRRQIARIVKLTDLKNVVYIRHINQ